MILKVETLSKTYQQGDLVINALKNVSFAMDEGQTLAIVGPSGSGKTTLLSLLAGLESPTSGSIYFDGTDLAGLSERELTGFRSRKIGIVFQQFHLMPHLSAQENVELPLEIQGAKDLHRKAEEALAAVGLSDRRRHLPRELSGGECQRVAIARAFVSRPKLLLADEPSGSLDQATGDKVIDLLFALSRERATTMILVTHDQKLADRCDTQLRLEKGEKA